MFASENLTTSYLPEIHAVGILSSMDKMLLGRRMKAKLKDMRKTQSWLAEQLGLSNPAVTKWIQGKADPTLSNLREMARLLNCTVGYLSGDEENDNVAAITEMAKHMTKDTQEYYRKSGISLVEPEEKRAATQ